MLIWTICHTAAHYVNFFNVERSQVRPEAAVQIHYTQAGGVTGHIMLLCMLLMYTTAHARIRKQSFETFWYTHHLFIPFLLGMYTHATGCFVRDSVQPYSPFAGKQFWEHCIGDEGWRWELIGGGLYLIERVYREIRARRETRILRVIRHPFGKHFRLLRLSQKLMIEDTMEIQFAKPSMTPKPGQYLFLNCPEVSKFQWHPFTITSCPFDTYISVHVRQVGDFTKELGNALGAGPMQKAFYDEIDPMGIYEIDQSIIHEMPPIRIDGPYGAPAEDVLDNDVAILIGTGIGVTPFASVLKTLWHHRTNGTVPIRLRRIEFFWICRDTSSFAWFQALLVSLEAQSLEQSEGFGDDFLRIHTYLTKSNDMDTVNNIVLNSIGTEKDPLTELRSRTNFGRPDWKRLLVGMREGILEETYMPNLDTSRKTQVGVYFCGPSDAARNIKAAAKEADHRRVPFKFWKEHF
jgi:NADPH oxidase